MGEKGLNLSIVNISLKDAIMPKEFYWNELQIDLLNEAFANAQPYQTQNFQIFAPRMPLNSTPLSVALHVKNSSESETELRVFKQPLCDCSVTKSRLRQTRKEAKCMHKSITEIRPASVAIKPDAVIELELTFRYDLLGQQEVNLLIVSKSFTIKLKSIVTSVEFDPSSMLITNQLAPVAINLFPPPQQALWLYNPYLADIKLGLISGSVEIALANEELVIGSHQHMPLLLTFAPFYVGRYELQIEIVFNECKSSMHIHGECIGREQDLLDSIFRINSPCNALCSKLNSFVLHGDNVCIVQPQNGISSENLIGLQNNSKNCIKYDWAGLRIAAFSCEISVEPQTGYLSPGSTKLFRVTVKSLGRNSMLFNIPVKCSIYHYLSENFREYTLPDGYFEYTERGYYEKPLNWSPKCLKYLQSVYLNVNIRALNPQEIIKYTSESSESNEGEHLMRQYLLGRVHHMNALPTVVSDADECVNMAEPEMKLNKDEQELMETLIGSILNGSKFKARQETRSVDQHYATLDGNHHHTSPNVGDIKAERKSLIPELLNDILFHCFDEISKEHRFIPSAW